MKKMDLKQAVESTKSWSLMGYFCPKKCISSARTYTEDLSNITFNFLRENSPNDLCHFWNHMSFFMKQHLYIFLSQTLDTFYKSSLSKWKFSDLPLLTLKFTKFLMSFLEPRVSFSSNFASLFSVMRHNSSVLFHLNLYMLWTKEAHQSANFQTFNCSHEN